MTIAVMLWLLGSRMQPLLGEAGNVATDDLMKILGWVSTFIMLVIAAVVTPMLKQRWKSEGKQEVIVGPQPFEVELRKEFITRTEHNEHRAEVKADFIRMEGSINRMTDKVESKHMELLLTIERAAKTGVDGRVALWNELKPLSNELAALKATSNVADQLAKLANSLDKKTDAKTTRN